VLARFLAEVINCNDLRGGVYFEPYAGGAGAAIDLVSEGVVSDVYINDADSAIACFWKAAIKFNSRFVDSVLDVPLNVAEWRRQKAAFTLGPSAGIFKYGFSAFYLNRTSRSGILKRSGPIGGYDQTGTYKINARFNRKDLAIRIFELSKYKKHIHVSNLDAIEFLKETLPYRNSLARRKVFVYLDPPYYLQASRLYMNHYKHKDHAVLAKYLSNQRVLPWLLSYDDAEPIKALYPECDIHSIPLNHSTQGTSRKNELLIVPRHIKLPVSVQLYGEHVLLPRKSGHI
jgi:DNA adenine methylase